MSPPIDLEADFAEMNAADFSKYNQELEALEDEKYKDLYCRWEGCFLKFKNLDELAEHIAAEHVSSKKENAEAEYVCHWENCTRQGSELHSRFALLSHIRMHTGEKPFYCPVPECLKSYTRSDALLKHLNTAHELQTNSLAEAAETVRERMEKETKRLSEAVSSGPSDTVEFREKQDAKFNGSVPYNDVIQQYCQHQGSADAFVQALVTDVYGLGKVKLNPAMKDNVFKDLRLALNNYNLKKKDLEDKSGAVSVAELSEEALEQNVGALEEYYEKLVKLRGVLDSELEHSTLLARYWWLKKERVFEGILKNNEEAIVQEEAVKRQQ